MTDRDDEFMRRWTRHAFDGEPPAGSIGDTIGDDLARAHSGLRRHRRRRDLLTSGGAAAVAAITVSVLAFGGTVLPTSDDADGAPPASDSQPEHDTEPLDLGPLTDSQQLDPFRDGFVDPVDIGEQISVDEMDGYTFPFARRMASPAGPTSMVIARPPSGEALAVSSDRGGGAVHPTIEAPNAKRPIRGVRARYHDWIYPQSAGYWVASGVYRVHDAVDRVEVRVGTPDGSEPWRVAEPHGGYVVWATWFEKSAYEAGDRLTLQWRAYDTDGNRIDPALMPDQPSEVVVPKSEPKGRNNEPPGPTREDKQLRRLYLEVARDHLDPDGEHLTLSDKPATHTAWWIFEWRIEGDPGLGGVRVETRAPGQFTAGPAGDLVAMLGCHSFLDPCERRDLGAEGKAWVGESAEGSIGVALIRPDGAAVMINIDPTFNHPHPESSLSEDMGLTIEDAIDVVTDDRFDQVFAGR